MNSLPRFTPSERTVLYAFAESLAAARGRRCDVFIHEPEIDQGERAHLGEFAALETDEKLLGLIQLSSIPFARFALQRGNRLRVAAAGDDLHALLRKVA
jgi:hypothetical protein